MDRFVRAFVPLPVQKQRAALQREHDVLSSNAAACDAQNARIRELEQLLRDKNPPVPILTSLASWVAAPADLPQLPSERPSGTYGDWPPKIDPARLQKVRDGVHPRTLFRDLDRLRQKPSEYVALEIIYDKLHPPVPAQQRDKFDKLGNMEAVLL